MSLVGETAPLDRTKFGLKRIIGSYRFWVGLGISLSLFYLSFREINFFDLLATWQGAQWWFILGAVAAYFLDVAIRAVRWRWLLKDSDSISFSHLWQALIVGYAVNNLLPFRAGELARAHWLGRSANISRTTVLASVVVERLCDGLSVALISLVLPFIMPTPAWVQWVTGLALIFFLGGLGVLSLALVARDRVLNVWQFILRPLPPKWGAYLYDLGFATLEGWAILGSLRSLFVVAGLSLLTWLVGASEYLFASLVFGTPISYELALLTLCMASLATAIPSLPAYIGTYEFVTIGVLTLSNLSATARAGLVLTVHAVLIVPVTLIGIIYLWRADKAIRRWN